MLKRIPSYFPITMSYHTALPNSQRAQYEPNETIDFTLNYPGFSLLPNSLRISGKLEVLTNDANDNLTRPDFDLKTILFDHNAGIHGCIDSIVTSVNDSVIENIQSYNRLVKVQNQLTNTDLMMASASRHVCEMVTHADTDSKAYVSNLVSNENAFSMKPRICLNNTGVAIPYSKSGEIKLQIRLANANNFLFGADVDNTTTFRLKDVRCDYRLVPTTGKTGGAIQMTVHHLVKQSIQSNNVNLNINVPLPTTAVNATFIRTGHLNVNANNHLATEILPGINRVEFSFNDQTNQMIHYPLETNLEILYNWLRSFAPYTEPGYNDIRLQSALADPGEGFGVGMPYLTVLANDKLGINIQSNNVNDNFTAFIYFKGILSL